MSDLMMSVVSDVVMNDITSAMMTSPDVIQTIANNLECIARGTRSPLPARKQEVIIGFLQGSLRPWVSLENFVARFFYVNGTKHAQISDSKIMHYD